MSDLHRARWAWIVSLVWNCIIDSDYPSYRSLTLMISTKLAKKANTKVANSGIISNINLLRTERKLPTTHCLIARICGQASLPSKSRVLVLFIFPYFMDFSDSSYARLMSTTADSPLGLFVAESASDLFGKRRSRKQWVWVGQSMLLPFTLDSKALQFDLDCMHAGVSFF